MRAADSPLVSGLGGLLDIAPEFNQRSEFAYRPFRTRFEQEVFYGSISHFGLSSASRGDAPQLSL